MEEQNRQPNAANTAPDSQQNLKPDQNGGNSLKDFLKTPWYGLRPDLILHPGPIEHDGQRSWVLEDPVRGNNFRLGFVEGELIYRLSVEPDLDKAAANLYTTTGLRPTPQEILSFIGMLQRESLARIPPDEAVRRESAGEGTAPPFLRKILQGTIFFQVPLIRPDRFLAKTLPWVKPLWSPAARWFYLICGILGLALTLPEIELYLGTINYLFTPQGAFAFILCLVTLKIGHEFAHAYTAKAMGLHVPSMGIFFIVLWPLLYTDTTDAWKIPDRRRRMWISAAGVLFELVVAGLALLYWALLPDGILKSLMFFLSGTSLVSSVFINLNPFMRYDGYYLLMDAWGIDNLRPRAFAMLRHWTRQRLLGWKEPAPEIHPNRNWMIFYGFLALLYRLFIGLAIAIAVYYLFFPALGLLILGVEIWIFFIRPLYFEIKSVVRERKKIGSRKRAAITGGVLLTLILLLLIPLPRYTHLPSLLLYEGANRLDAPSAGRIVMSLPEPGKSVRKGDLIIRIQSGTLRHEVEGARFDLASVRATLQSLGGGGEQGAYRNWLLEEENRLMAVLEKLTQAQSLLEIRSPADGRITDVNPDLYKNAYVNRETYLFTVADPEVREVRAYVHERLVQGVSAAVGESAKIRFGASKAPAITGRLREKSLFPVYYLPNESLLDAAGGSMISVSDTRGLRPKDAYFTFLFEVDRSPKWLPHGMPGWIWLPRESRPILTGAIETIWKHLTERGLF